MKELTMSEVEQVSGGVFTIIALGVLSGLSMYVTIQNNKPAIVRTLNSIGGRAQNQRGAKAWQG